jgi:hypothetical protein
LDKAPLQHTRGLFYALVIPGFLGLVLSKGSRKQTRRGVRLISFIAVLALFALWMAACGGGGSSTPSNPGTPTGTSSVTVTAATGGTTSLMHSVTPPITLTIQ